MRLIDADALQPMYFGKRGGLIHTSDIDNAPTINPKPVRYGHWIECQGGLKCSECGYYPLSRIILRGEKIWEADINEDLFYCPNCGAKMGEAKDNE